MFEFKHDGSGRSHDAVRVSNFCHAGTFDKRRSYAPFRFYIEEIHNKLRTEISPEDGWLRWSRTFRPRILRSTFGALDAEHDNQIALDRDDE